MVELEEGNSLVVVIGSPDAVDNPSEVGIVEQLQEGNRLLALDSHLPLEERILEEHPS